MLNKIITISSVKRQIQNSRKKLYQGAYSWCHNSALAEDLVQEALLKALSSKSELRNIKHLDTWLFRILVNTWHDYLKSKIPLVNIDDYVLTSNSDVESNYLKGGLITLVRQKVSKLKMPLREVISLIDFSGFSYQEVSDIMSIPIGTVMSRLHRARNELAINLIAEDKKEMDNYKKLSDERSL